MTARAWKSSLTLRNPEEPPEPDLIVATAVGDSPLVIYNNDKWRIPEGLPMGEQRVIDLLGGTRAIGTKVERELDFDREIKKGFRFGVVQRFKKNTMLSNALLSRVLGISQRTMDRMVVVKSAARIKPAVSDRLYRTAKVVALAEEVFEDRGQALEWLSSRQAGLGDRVPFDLLETGAGTCEVEEELERIEHGFVA